MTTTRCSRAKDEDPWQERPGPGAWAPPKRRHGGQKSCEIVGWGWGWNILSSFFLRFFSNTF